ncbi:MAG: hypothetical protein HYR90_04375 [Candidatus Andersenbacteria bacterium]|nr:hypothetical protein [Candidatus Andersenbacteria bacterium]MBI3250626.1 hypothetical protein [Candidatus Andersenbacteria bacterium]
MPSVWYWLLVVGVILLIPTAYAGKIGAPWVPTRKRAIMKALQELEIGKGSTVVDLGAGDGKVLVAAVSNGATAIGFELSPIMWVIATLRTLGRAQVIWGNFYKKPLPANTTAVFVFLLPETMPRLKKYLKEQSMPTLKYVMSYAFPFKDIVPVKVIKEPKCAAIYVYDPRAVQSS